MKIEKSAVLNTIRTLAIELPESVYDHVYEAINALPASEDEWVRCEDSLPHKDGDSSIYCLVSTKRDGILVRPYNEYHKCWDQEDGDDHYTIAVGGDVTHWMYLPQPPKP